jgi:hypothetical protein
VAWKKPARSPISCGYMHDPVQFCEQSGETRRVDLGLHCGQPVTLVASRCR